MIADGWSKADTMADEKLNENLKGKYGEDLKNYTDVPRIAVAFEQFWQEDFAHVAWTLALGESKHTIKLIHAGETVSRLRIPSAHLPAV
jgi:hypothetical protein